MIILQGPDEKLRTELFRLIAPEVRYNYKTGETYRADLNYLVSQVHLNRYHLRDQFLHELPQGPARSMLGMALASAGSIAVICGKMDEEAMAYSSMDGRIPVIPAEEFLSSTNTHNVASLIIEIWLTEQRRIEPLYDYWGAGGLQENPVMLVGEANQDMGSTKRRAFISHKGCSLYLHEAICANKETNYYLTNAVKSDNAKFNLAALADEIDIVKPRRIIALGAVAATTLSELRAQFERTWHPSYWMRFKPTDISELADFIK